MQSLNVVFDRFLSSKFDELCEDPPALPAVGVVIGHRSSSTIFVVHVALTNPSDDSATANGDGRTESPTTKQGDGSRSVLDGDSILQHVRQTVRVLPGGLDVVGLIVITDRKCTDLLPELTKKLRSSFKTCLKYSRMNGAVDATESPLQNMMLLVNLDKSAGSKKPTVTAVSCGADAQSGAPSSTIPFSFQQQRWSSFATRIKFDIPLIVSGEDAANSFFKQFVDSVGPWCKQLWVAPASINGKIHDDNTPLNVVLKSISKSATKEKSSKGKQKKKPVNNVQYSGETEDDGEPNAVDIYLQNVANDSARSERAVIYMHVRGAMYCLAFVQPKATIGEAIRAIKIDAMRSLYARCELHYDGMAVLEGEELDPLAVHQFPRRVFAPLPSSPLLVSDYLFEGDGPQDSVDAFRDLFELQLTPEDVDDTFENIPDQDTIDQLMSPITTSSPSAEASDNAEILGSKESGSIVQSNNAKRGLQLVCAVLVVILAYIVYVFLAAYEVE